MAHEIADNKKEARELFNYQFIKEAIQDVFPENSLKIMNDLATMIIFDAIVGNNDRHFYNWGIISSPIKSKLEPTFSPIYDSARGLFWNLHIKNIMKYLDDPSKMEKYIQKSYPRISIPTNPEANHFDLVDHILIDKENYMEIKKKLCSIENEQNVITMLEKELFPLLHVVRRQAIREVLHLRFKRLRGL